MPNEIVIPKNRTQLFNDYTKKKIQIKPSQSIYENRKTIIDLDQVDLTSDIYLIFEITCDFIHATLETYTPERFAPYGLLNRIHLQLDNNFTPYDISGITAYLLQLASLNPSVWTPNSSTSTRTSNLLGLVSDTDGGGNENNIVQFVVRLPLTLNERDLNGILVTQNKKTNCKITLDVGTALAGILASASGFSTDDFLGTVTPIVITYEIPQPDEAKPDWRQIKLTHEEQFTIASAGTTNLLLDAKGMVRRIFIDLHDGTDGFADSEVSNFIIKENVTNRPWEINAKGLMIMNQELYGQAMPKGVWVIDAASQGVPNYGNHRDWFDTNNLTTFHLAITSTNTGTAKITTESLVQLY